MALEELSWVRVLGDRIGIAEDALRLIIGMVLGETLFCRRVFAICIPQPCYIIIPLLVYPIIELIQSYDFSLSRVFATQQISP